MRTSIHNSPIPKQQKQIQQTNLTTETNSTRSKPSNQATKQQSQHRNPNKRVNYKICKTEHKKINKTPTKTLPSGSGHCVLCRQLIRTL